MNSVILQCNNCTQKLRVPENGNYEVICPKCKASRVLMREFEGINIAVIGKTGIGKSSFCNYIFDSDVFNSGSGKPVTNWDENFQHHTVEYDKYRLNIFDSVGLEATNLPEWRSKLHNFIYEHSFLKAKPKQWVHGVFYLISAASARLENIEAEIITDLVQRHIPVQIILSKVDQAKDVEVQSLKEKLKEISSDLMIHEACSVAVKKRVGSTERFGREEILNSFLADLDEKLKFGILQYSLKNYVDTTKEIAIKLRGTIKQSDLGFYTFIKEALSDSSRDFEEVFNIDTSSIDNLSEESEAALDELDAFLSSYGYSYNNSARQELDRIQKDVDHHLEMVNLQLDKKLKDIEDRFEGGIGDKISGVIEAGKILFGIKGFVLKLIDDFMNPLIAQLESEARKYGVK